MTIATDSPGNQSFASPAMKPRLLTRRLVQVLLVSFGAMTSFYLLLSTVPLYADAIGAGATGAGLATGVLMLSTVGVELITPALVARLGKRRAVGAGLLLLGAPALALPGSTSLAAILVACLVRGAGLAIVVVVVGAWIAEIAPRDRRGEALGLAGVVATVPAVVMLPLGVWLAERVGYPPLFIGGALTALAGLLAMVGLADVPVESAQQHKQPFRMRDGLRSPALLRPAIVFSATAMAAGIVATFLPLALGEASGELAAIALLTQAATATASRWWAGRYGDRHGARKLLMPSVLVAAIGMSAVVVISSPVAVLAGMALFGAGFGMAQNSSLTVMFERVPSSGYGTVSAVWNLAYDAGLGIGATGFGMVVMGTGYSAAFALTAGFMLVVLFAALPRRASHDHSGTAWDVDRIGRRGSGLE
ncbi:MAG TPA: MFS transporter [Jiangellaceae bacterium]